MRPLILTSLALAALSAIAAEPAQSYPLWDGQETIADYAKRTGLEPTKTLDLGGGVKLELVLIPAGKFIMGMAMSESPWIGGAILAVAITALILLATPLIRAVNQRRRPQFSLRRLIMLVAVLGVAQYGGFRCWRAAWARKSFYSDASPAHSVTISKPFYIGKYEVTQDQYQQIIGNNSSRFKGGDLPVEQVSWDEAKAFCKEIGEKTRASVRLPREAEWEYACRAGTTTRFCSGDTDRGLETVAWCGANSRETTHPVGQKTPNAWGLYDMHGNVWEWCTDWYGDYGAGAVMDSQGPTEGAARVLRGGSGVERHGNCGSACRDRDDARACSFFSGFRVAVSVPRMP